MIPVLYW